MAELINSAVQSPEYVREFTPKERAVLAIFAMHAVLIINAGRCDEPLSTSTAEETFLVLFIGLTRQPTLDPVFTLPKARQAELVTQAMALATQGLEAVGRDFHCPQNRVLPDSAVPPLSDRLARTRNLLGRALSAANWSPALVAGPNKKGR